MKTTGFALASAATVTIGDYLNWPESERRGYMSLFYMLMRGTGGSCPAHVNATVAERFMTAAAALMSGRSLPASEVAGIIYAKLGCTVK